MAVRTQTQVIRLHSEYTGNCYGTNWKGYKNGKLSVDSNGKVRNSGYTGEYCASSLAIPARVTTPDGGIVSVCGIESLSFCECQGMSGWLTIPPDILYIGDYAFYNCKCLCSGMSLAGYMKTIGKFAFGNCCNITGSLEIPKFVTSLGSGAFFNCKSIGPKLTIYGGLKFVGHDAFHWMCNVKEIVFVNFQALPKWDGMNIFADMSPTGIIKVIESKIIASDLLKYLKTKGLPANWTC